ncbi:MAG: aldo/keto reductase [Pseudomonadales bacterium]
MQEGRWGIIATGRIAGAFADALGAARGNRLVAAASRNQPAAEAFAARYPDVRPCADYAALLDDPELDAVYVATPHPQHAEWALRALAAGKAVLCEKPLGLNHPEVMAMVDAASRDQRLLMEAFMYRCHPQTLRLVALVRDGAIGELRHIEASFGYHAAFDPDSRLFANRLAGGGIMDVGCYPVSAARLLAAAEPVEVVAHGHLGRTGVDEWSAALLKFDNGLSAQVASSVSVGLDNSLSLYGSAGRIHLRNPWLCADAAGNWSFDLIRNGRDRETVSGQAEPLYVLEAEHFAGLLRDGRVESPLMSWQDSLGNALALDAWRHAIGLEFEQERPASHRGPLLGRAPRAGGKPDIDRAAVPGLAKPASRLVMGCDNQPSMSHAAVMWDAFFELGGNTFDTAYIYGGGTMEKFLGHWHQQRGLRDELVIIGKGAHTPDNFPEAIAPQLTESLERLQTDSVDVYFLHRDNPEVPAAEFIDALNAEVRRGRIGVFGGSNWTLPRLREANDYARRHQLQGFSAVSNNFSLARMVAPIWPGVEAASDPVFRDYLRATGMALMPWSSQARGFFTPWAAQVRADAARENPAVTRVQPTIAELRRTWFADDNFERRDRAEALARRRGVELINVALAYVLCQPFPCFPLIGPRTLAELRSCVAALAIELAPEDLAWLNLER